jgi:hypothetical protein
MVRAYLILMYRVVFEPVNLEIAAVKVIVDLAQFLLIL